MLDPFSNQLLLDLLMRGQMPPGLMGGVGMPGAMPAATPGIAGPMNPANPETVLPAIRPAGGGLRDVWRGIGGTYEGEELPDDIARANRKRAMLDAGMALLAGAGRQQPGEAIATGMSAFRGGLDRESEGYLKRRREGEEFDLRKRSAEESMTASREARARAAAAEERAVGEYGYTQESRAGAREAMRDLVREVEEISGKDSDEADRARALYKGGPALFQDLEAHHKSVLDRKNAPEIAGEQTDAEIERRKRLFAEDPEGMFNRNMEVRRLRAYEGQVSAQGRGVSETSLLSRLQTKANGYYKALIDQNSLGGVLRPGTDTLALWDQAEKMAEEDLLGDLGEGGFLDRARGGGASAQGLPEVDTEALGAAGTGRVRIAPGQGNAAPPSPAEVAAVRQSLANQTEQQVRQSLAARGVPAAKIDELLRLASGG